MVNLMPHRVDGQLTTGGIDQNLAAIPPHDRLVHGSPERHVVDLAALYGDVSSCHAARRALTKLFHDGRIEPIAPLCGLFTKQRACFKLQMIFTAQVDQGPIARRSTRRWKAFGKLGFDLVRELVVRTSNLSLDEEALTMRALRVGGSSYKSQWSVPTIDDKVEHGTYRLRRGGDCSRL